MELLGIKGFSFPTFAGEMKGTPENIHPIFDTLLQRHDKEALLKQKSRVFWFTGLSGSGKSAVARGLEKKLHELGFLVMVLDGDNVRAGINNNLSFSHEDRIENIRRIAEVSKLFVQCGVITLNCFVSPTADTRDLARTIIGPDDFLEIFVDAPLEVCEQRDVKGLYAKARRGEIKDFTGIDAPFEAPIKPALHLKTDRQNLEETIQITLDFVLPNIRQL